MTMYYAKSTGGFYTTEIHITLPSDSVEVLDDDYQLLLHEQAMGKQITADEKGYPIVIDRIIIPLIELTPQEKLANAGLTVIELKSLLGIN